VAFAVPVLLPFLLCPNCCTLSTSTRQRQLRARVGVLLSIESAPLQIQRNVFYCLPASWPLSRDARCHFVWPMGLPACGGVLLATAPVAIYRHAHA